MVFHNTVVFHIQLPFKSLNTPSYFIQVPYHPSFIVIYRKYEVFHIFILTTVLYFKTAIFSVFEQEVFRTEGIRNNRDNGSSPRKV